MFLQNNIALFLRFVNLFLRISPLFAKMQDFLLERLKLKDQSNKDLAKRLTEGGYPVSLEEMKKKYGKNAVLKDIFLFLKWKLL